VDQHLPSVRLGLPTGRKAVLGNRFGHERPLDGRRMAPDGDAVPIHDRATSSLTTTSAPPPSVFMPQSSCVAIGDHRRGQHLLDRDALRSNAFGLCPACIDAQP